MRKLDDYSSIMKVPEEIFSKMNACPVETGFNALGHRYTVLILRDMLLFGKRRFADFLESVEGISRKTLTTRLRRLENDGMIRRRVYHAKPIRAEYQLTKKGKMLRPVLEQMAAYSLSYCGETVFEDGDPRSFKKIFGRSPMALME